MKIIFHIGPHKTGTTSLQAYLSRTFSIPSLGAVFYPPAAKWGPGHAQMAWQLLGLNGVAQSNDYIASSIAAAQAAEVDMLILSSEEFSRAFADRIHLIRDALKGHQCHLIVTLSSMVRRAFGEWQELLKHGENRPLAEALEQILNKQPGMQPDLVSKFVEILIPEKTSVIMSTHGSDPSQLFHNFGKAIGLSLNDVTLQPRDPNSLSLNRSLGQIESEMLRAMNGSLPTLRALAPNIRYFALRDRLLGMFHSPAWKANIPHIDGQIPAEFKPLVSRRAREQLREIERLVDLGKVQLFGSSTALLDGIGNQSRTRSTPLCE